MINLKLFSSEIEFNESENLQMVYFQEELKASNWRPQIEELPPRSIESIHLQVFNHQNLI
jgi:hypothetical protein